MQMIEQDIQKLLFEQRDEAYADFQSRLMPGIPRESLIGVRVPRARALARELVKGSDWRSFLDCLPHRYYDENLLHGLLISEIRDYGDCIRCIDAFLPYVDNWAVCDLLSPKIFKKHKQELTEKIREWIASPAVYTCRFGLEMLMSHYLDADFGPEVLGPAASVRSEEYYVRMMQAWFFATALAKQWESALPYLIEEKLDVWTHNKTIQKACESYRISEEQKAYLRTLKR